MTAMRARHICKRVPLVTTVDVVEGGGHSCACVAGVPQGKGSAKQPEAHQAQAGMPTQSPQLLARSQCSWHVFASVSGRRQGDGDAKQPAAHHSQPRTDKHEGQSCAATQRSSVVGATVDIGCCVDCKLVVVVVVGEVVVGVVVVVGEIVVETCKASQSSPVHPSSHLQRWSTQKP